MNTCPRRTRTLDEARGGNWEPGPLPTVGDQAADAGWTNGLADSPALVRTWIYEGLHNLIEDYTRSDDEGRTWASIYSFNVAGDGNGSPTMLRQLKA